MKKYISFICYYLSWCHGIATWYHRCRRSCYRHTELPSHQIPITVIIILFCCYSFFFFFFFFVVGRISCCPDASHLWGIIGSPQVVSLVCCDEWENRWSWWQFKIIFLVFHFQSNIILYIYYYYYISITQLDWNCLHPRSESQNDNYFILFGYYSYDMILFGYYSTCDELTIEWWWPHGDDAELSATALCVAGVLSTAEHLLRSSAKPETIAHSDTLPDFDLFRSSLSTQRRALQPRPSYKKKRPINKCSFHALLDDPVPQPLTINDKIIK